MNANPAKTTEIAPNTRWGEGSVDLDEASLPALKAKWALSRIAEMGNKLRILDYGCGEGKLLRTINRRFPLHELFGTDIRTPQRADDFHFVPLSENALRMNEGSFDVITSIDVLEHVHDLERTLRQMHALLKPGGRLLLFVPAEGQLVSPYNFYRLFLGKNLYEQTKDHVQKYRRGALVKSVAQIFRVTNVTYSYHLLGSLMDATFFALCKIPAVSRWWWNSNPYYRPSANVSFPGRIIKFANSICYFESRLLSKIPLSSSGVHIEACKP